MNVNHGGHGFDSRRGLRFFLCPTLVTNWIFHLSYFFPSLTFTIFLSSLSHTVLSTLLILAVCRTRVTNELSKYDLARHESPSSSVVRAPDRCTGGHGFDSRRGLRFFLCPTLVTNWIFHLSHIIFVNSLLLKINKHTMNWAYEKNK